KIGSAANVEFSSAVSGPAIAFADGSGTLILDSPSSFQSSIAGLAIGDTIDLVNTSVQSTSISGSTLTVTETNGQTLTYQVSGSLSGNSFSTLSDSTGTKLILVPSSGTKITGANSAGSLVFNPTSTQLYQLVGATISGNGGHGFFINSSDSNLGDNM